MSDRPFDAGAIDDVIHGRVRLGIVAYLASVRSASFPELREALGATDGNLSTHLRKLEEAGYVSAHKGFVARKPQTRLALTASGRSAWHQWLDRIEALTRAAAGSTERKTS